MNAKPKTVKITIGITTQIPIAQISRFAHSVPFYPDWGLTTYTSWGLLHTADTV